MKKIDYKKEQKSFYHLRSGKIEEVDIPAFRFLMIDGFGDPNDSPFFAEACEALFSVSYKIKFALKKETQVDYAVMPLEGLWWVEKGEFNLQDKRNWSWTLMVRQPDCVTGECLDKAKLEVAKKKPHLDNLSKIRLEEYEEGFSSQILHLGPYSEEQSTIDALHQGIKKNGYSERGRHHEIYLNDPSRTVPEKLKTLIRQPVKRQAS